MIAGSVRRCRTVNSAMSSGPFRMPKNACEAITSTIPASGSMPPAVPAGAEAATGSSSATVGTMSAIGTTSIRHSRPRVSNRPKKADETIPVMPDMANASPTSAGL